MYTRDGKTESLGPWSRYLLFKTCFLNIFFHRQEFARAKDESGSVDEGLHKIDDKYQKQSGTIDSYFHFDPEAYFII